MSEPAQIHDHLKVIDGGRAKPDQIPPSIVKAICTIKATMEAVKKTTKNLHGGYMFSSTDDIYAALSRKMGEVGLACLSLEDHEPEIQRVETSGTDKQGNPVTKIQQWGKFTFSFVLATEDATWSDPRSRRTLFLQITGPQTFQAAQSFAEKAYLRSMFKIPSGDMDLDSMAQADSEEDQAALNANGRKRKSSYGAKKDGVTTELFNTIKQQMEQAANVDLLQQIKIIYTEEIAELPRAWSELIDHTYEDRMSALQAD